MGPDSMGHDPVGHDPVGPGGALPPELAAAERLDEILAEFAAYPQPVVQDRVVELLRCVDAIHRPGLQRLAELLESAGLLDAALGDPRARLLLGLYGLDPDAGDAEAVPAWHELPVVHGASSRLPEPATGGFVPLSSVRIKRPPRLEWRAAFRADRLPPGETGAVEVEGAYVLVANLEGELRAYRDACPGSPLPLHGGQLDGTVLECPWHHCRYDLRDGARLGGSGAGLAAVPVAVEGGVVRIGIVRERDGVVQEPGR